MTDWLFLLSNIAAGIIRVHVCLFLIFRLLSVEKPGKKSTAAALAGVTVICILAFVTGFPDFYRGALEAVWIAFCAGRLQKVDIRMSLFVGTFYEIAVWFWQFLFAAWLGVLFSSPAYLDYRTGEGQTAVWLLHGLLIVLEIYLSGHRDMTEKEAFRRTSVIVLAGFLAVITLSEQSVLSIADDTLYMWTILASVLMMSVLVFNINRHYEAEKELARLKSQQAELLEHDYTALNNAYAANAKLFHDFHNHIGVLRQLLSHKKTEEAVQYLDELQSPVQEMADAVWTGDETADYLINSKALAAKVSGVPLQVQVEFPRHTNIKSADLCAILGNLLDNALEASRKVADPKHRFIRLTIRRINQMLVIKVENSFAVLPKKEDGSLKTTKKDRELHGWGLKSAQTAAEKYEVTVQTSYTDSTFRAVATLSYHGVTPKE